MTLGRCPLSIFSSRGTPPRNAHPVRTSLEEREEPGRGWVICTPLPSLTKKWSTRPLFLLRTRPKSTPPQVLHGSFSCHAKLHGMQFFSRQFCMPCKSHKPVPAWCPLCTTWFRGKGSGFGIQRLRFSVYG